MENKWVKDAQRKLLELEAKKSQRRKNKLKIVFTVMGLLMVSLVLTLLIPSIEISLKESNLFSKVTAQPQQARVTSSDLRANQTRGGVRYEQNGVISDIDLFHDDQAGTITRVMNITVDGQDFGANYYGSRNGETNLFFYNISTNYPIQQLGDFTFMIMKEEIDECIFNPFDNCINNNPVIDFSKECALTPERVTRSACNFEINGNHLKANFKADHDNSTGFTRIDPTITFSTDDIRGVKGIGLSDNTFVVGWCDFTNLDITFETFFTNGTSISGPIDADIDKGSCFSIQNNLDLAAKNETNFVIAWQDNSGGDADAQWQRFNLDGTNSTDVISVGTGVGGSNDGVAITMTNETTLVYTWYDDPNGRMRGKVFNDDGTNTTGIFDIDSTVGSGTSGIDVSAINSTSAGFIYTDSSAQIVQLTIVNTDGTLGVTGVVVDNSISGSQAVQIESYDEDFLALAWFDGTTGNQEYQTFRVNGTVFSSVINLHTSSTASTNTISLARLNLTAVAVGYSDDGDSDMDFQVVDIDGNILVSETTVDANGQSGQLKQQAFSSEFVSETSLCDNNFIYAWRHSATESNWTSFFSSDGTIWDGVCFEPPPEVGPVITNAEINDSSVASLGTIVKVNATITDINDDVITANIRALLPNGSFQNFTMVNTTSHFFNVSINLSQAGQWVFEIFATDGVNQGTPVIAVAQDGNQFINVDIKPIEFDFNSREPTANGVCFNTTFGIYTCTNDIPVNGNMPQRETSPTTCSAGDQYFDTTSPGAFCGCVEENIWMQTGGAGSCDGSLGNGNITLNPIEEIIMSDGGGISSNSTCLFITSPDISTILEVCDV